MYKKVGGSRRQSHRRDAIFLNNLRLLRAFGHKRLSGGTSVVLSVPGSIDGEVLPTRLPALDSGSPSVAPWRDCTYPTRVVFIQRELEKRGPCYMFDLNLSYTVLQAATTSLRGFVDYVRRRISLHLMKATNEQPDFWFAIEKTRKGQPHLHGAIRANPDQLESVKAALRLAAGKWEKGRGYQLRMVAVFLGDGVADYAMKARNPGHPKHATVVPVGRFAVTQNLCAAARRTYEDERRLIQSLRRKGVKGKTTAGKRREQAAA